MTQVDHLSAEASRRPTILEAYRETFLNVVRSPVTWIIVAIMLVSAIYMVLVGQTRLMLNGLISTPFNLIFALIIIPLTIGKPKAPWENPPAYSRQRLWVQLGGCLLLILLLQVFLILIFDLFNLRSAGIPLLSPLAAYMYAQLQARNYLFLLPVAVMLETILPLGLMRSLGARWQELGFCKGYHIWRVTLVLSAVYLVFFAIAIGSGKASIFTILGGIGVNFFEDGLVEETLFRGVVMTRLTQLFGVAWGIGLSALLFGLGHFSITMHALHNDVALSLAYVFVHYGMNGVFAGFFLLRPRNLVPMVISHTLGDAAIPYLPI
ncbi:MAG: CPBP family intramembrane metalloprotease [Chloroflexi bacterium]|nr:CPBP family intramembrane metalloprotease [Chloroflexota bacterium]